jgi:Tol biopolymer transport system component
MSRPTRHAKSADGSNQTEITDGSFEINDIAWAPNGESIAVVAEMEPNNADLFMMAVGDYQLTKIVGDPSQDSSPTWSPDSARIVFGSNRVNDSIYDIYVVNADGSNLVRITHNSNAHDNSPKWSPIISSE